MTDPDGRDSPAASGGTGQAITGRMSELYDVFVDWNGRLKREMPGIGMRLDRVGARKVLDVGCGTGRHVKALGESGYDAHGADTSADMLAQARDYLGGAERLHGWRLGDQPPATLSELAPFDAITCLGNVWPQLLGEDDARQAALGIASLLRPGGLLLIGMKALAVREERGDPYMPLLRRVHAGHPIWFVRFADFAVDPLPDGSRVCDFHMVVVAGSSAEDIDPNAQLHRASRMRVWDPSELEAWLGSHGFAEVSVSGKMDDRDATPLGEDIFVDARTPQ